MQKLGLFYIITFLYTHSIFCSHIQVIKPKPLPHSRIIQTANADICINCGMALLRFQDKYLYCSACSSKLKEDLKKICEKEFSTQITIEPTPVLLIVKGLSYYEKKYFEQLWQELYYFFHPQKTVKWFSYRIKDCFNLPKKYLRYQNKKQRIKSLIPWGNTIIVTINSICPQPQEELDEAFTAITKCTKKHLTYLLDNS